MATPERDPLTGYSTTGHEWDGIRELNTPIPGWWVTVFIVSCLVAVACLWLYPSVPTTSGYFKGTLGWTSSGQLQQEMAAGRAAQSDWLASLLATPLGAIEENEELRRFAIAGGRAAFAENCAACHGSGAGGQAGQFPALVDDDWLWGGKIDDIYQTISFGIRSDHNETRLGDMPAFDGVLSDAEIDDAASYVLALSDPALAATRQDMPGAAVFAQNCAACHGADGAGNREIGAPRLNDAIWLYGRRKESIVSQITNPRMGVMPAFAPRLEPSTIRMLAVFVHTLGGGER
jgi:cytochrome c oxidase cbb3-type subunit 3